MLHAHLGAGLFVVSRIISHRETGAKGPSGKRALRGRRGAAPSQSGAREESCRVLGQRESRQSLRRPFRSERTQSNRGICVGQEGRKKKRKKKRWVRDGRPPSRKIVPEAVSTRASVARGGKTTSRSWFLPPSGGTFHFRNRPLQKDAAQAQFVATGKESCCVPADVTSPTLSM